MKEQIALGFGDNVDYEIVWDSRAVEELIVRHGIRADDLAADRPIHTERDLVISILRFLQAGSGGERFIYAPAVIEEFAPKFAKKITLGGTPVRAAIAMHKLGYAAALHLVTINDHVRRLLPPGTPTVCSNAQDTAYPHLIIQFGQGARVQAGDIDICSARANRIIYHSDVDNVRMAINEAFATLVTQAQAFLVSGFNAMHDRALLVDRLHAVARILDHLPPTAQVFYEDAGFHDSSFSALIMSTLAPRLHIVSMNEDELQAYLGAHLDLLDPAQIRDALEALHGQIPAPTLVVHSMYWALAHGPDAPRYAAALKGGVTMATTRFCHGDDFTAADYAAIAQRPPNPAGADVADALNQLCPDTICCVPVAHVAQTDATTVGLGDAFVGGFLPALLP